MNSRGRRGFAAFTAFAFIAAFAPSVVAQPAVVPARVVQDSIGALHVVQGTNAWTLTPDQLSDSDLAAMNVIGEIDGTFPNQLLGTSATPQIVQASEGSLYVVEGGNTWTLVPDQISESDLGVLNDGGELNGEIPADLLNQSTPPAQTGAPVPIQPVATPTGIPPSSTVAQSCSAPSIAGSVDLTGKVANRPPGTLIAVGATISSMLDLDAAHRYDPLQSTKLDDVYAICVKADTTYQFGFGSNAFGGNAANIFVLSSDSIVVPNDCGGGPALPQCQTLQANGRAPWTAVFSGAVCGLCSVNYGFRLPESGQTLLHPPACYGPLVGVLSDEGGATPWPPPIPSNDVDAIRQAYRPCFMRFSRAGIYYIDFVAGSKNQRYTFTITPV
jgi:hypothetical protein